MYKVIQLITGLGVDVCARSHDVFGYLCRFLIQVWLYWSCRRVVRLSFIRGVQSQCYYHCGLGDLEAYPYIRYWEHLLRCLVLYAPGRCGFGYVFVRFKLMGFM